MKKIIVAIALIVVLLTMNSVVLAKDNSGNAGNGTKTQKAGSGPMYTDIAGHWAEDSINRISESSLFFAADGKFQPDKPITRSEFVLFLHKALGIQINYFKATDIGEFFSDVKNEDKYASALYDLVITNIIDFKGTFNPDNILTREEMVHYIMNAYKYKMGDKFKQIKLSTIAFADNDKINPVYGGEIARAEHDGLIKRPSNGKFYPRDAATRAQAVTVADRLLKLIDREVSGVSVIPAAEIKNGTLQMKLTITNNSADKVVISHSSGQKYDFKLLNAKRNSIYTWSADKSFIMAMSETVIDPGKSAEFTADVGKDTFNGPLGKAVYMKAYVIGASDNFKIDTDGYEAFIK